MFYYDERTPLLDDSYEGGEVAILLTVGRRVDKTFRRNYSWAKNALACGRLEKLTVVVVVNGDTWVHTAHAVASGLAAMPLPVGAGFSVDAPGDLIGSEGLSKILETVKSFEAPRPVRAAPPVRDQSSPASRVVSPKSVKGGDEKPVESKVEKNGGE